MNSLSETIIEPQRPIIDAHHHLWLNHAFSTADALANMAPNDPWRSSIEKSRRYLLDELVADLRSGHNVRATVFVEGYAMYRRSGPEAMRSVGEVEFAAGMAAMAASGAFGDIAVCAAIVGGIDLRMGEPVAAVLEAHINAGGGRYRGVRSSHTYYDPEPGIGLDANGPGVMGQSNFRAGFARLAKLGLSYDVVAFEPQLPEVIDLARGFPETPIVLDHVGLPLGIGGHALRRQARFPIWRDNIRTLSACSNVAVKLGGLGTGLSGFKSHRAIPPATSQELADEWKPYFESCIEAFGPNRCMFESNYPVDGGTADYAVIWNAFKRLTAGASESEKEMLFSGTAARIYRVELP